MTQSEKLQTLLINTISVDSSRPEIIPQVDWILGAKPTPSMRINNPRDADTYVKRLFRSYCETKDEICLEAMQKIFEKGYSVSIRCIAPILLFNFSMLKRPMEDPNCFQTVGLIKYIVNYDFVDLYQDLEELPIVLNICQLISTHHPALRAHLSTYLFITKQIQEFMLVSGLTMELVHKSRLLITHSDSIFGSLSIDHSSPILPDGSVKRYGFISDSITMQYINFLCSDLTFRTVAYQQQMFNRIIHVLSQLH